MSSAKWLKAVALKWFNFKNSNEAVKHKCFSELTNEENSILSWLDKNIQDNKLDYDKQLQMPNPKSFFDEKDKFKNINFAPGMIDSFIGDFDKQDSEKIAKELIGLFDKLVDIYEKNEGYGCCRNCKKNDYFYYQNDFIQPYCFFPGLFYPPIPFKNI